MPGVFRFPIPTERVARGPRMRPVGAAWLPWLSWLAWLLCALVCGASSGAQAQPEGFGKDPEALEIRLVTFGTGPAIHQYFGHNALWVYDRNLQWGTLYNYGMFSFGRDMLPKYLKGRLTFWVEATPVRRTFEFYRDMGRSVSVQELALSPAAKKRVFDRLRHDALPANRYYQYHHYTNNCSTQLRDVLDEALDGQLREAWSDPARFNYRMHTRRYAERNPALNMVLMFWMNDSMEVPIERWHETFLPNELADAVAAVVVDDGAGKRGPLVRNHYDVYTSDEPPIPAAPSAFTAVGAGLAGLALGGLALALGFVRRRGARWSRVAEGLYQSALGLVFGVPGLLGFLMWTLTEHEVTYANENQLLANPITFLLFPLGVMVAFGSRLAQRAVVWCSTALAVLAVGSLVLKVLPMFDQDNWIPMLLLLPLDLGLWAGQWVRTRFPSAAATRDRARDTAGSLARR